MIPPLNAKSPKLSLSCRLPSEAAAIREEVALQSAAAALRQQYLVKCAKPQPDGQDYAPPRVARRRHSSAKVTR